MIREFRPMETFEPIAALPLPGVEIRTLAEMEAMPRLRERIYDFQERLDRDVPFAQEYPPLGHDTYWKHMDRDCPNSGAGAVFMVREFSSRS